MKKSTLFISPTADITLGFCLNREIQLKARFHNPKMDCDCRVEARI